MNVALRRFQTGNALMGTGARSPAGAMWRRRYSAPRDEMPPVTPFTPARQALVAGTFISMGYCFLVAKRSHKDLLDHFLHGEHHEEEH